MGVVLFLVDLYDLLSTGYSWKTQLSGIMRWKEHSEGATTAMKEYICWLQREEVIESVRHVLQWRDGELVDLGK
jgi:hypothetical protein